MVEVLEIYAIPLGAAIHGVDFFFFDNFRDPVLVDVELERFKRLIESAGDYEFLNFPEI